MELWWWVEPLFYSGFILAVIALIICHLWIDSETFGNFIAILSTILILPLVISIVTAVVWIFYSTMHAIWAPYF